MRIGPAIAIILMLGGSAIGGCSFIDKVTGSVEQPRNTRSELLRTERVWQLTLSAIQTLTNSGIIVPNSPTAVRLDASIVIVELAMDKWRADPDNQSIKAFVVGAIDAVKKIITEIKK